MKVTKRTKSKSTKRYFQLICAYLTNTFVQLVSKLNDLRFSSNEKKKVALIYLYNRR